MCGRFSLGRPRDEILQLNGYNLRAGEWVHQDRFEPRHNIAPRSQAPVIRHAEGGGPSSSQAPSNHVVLHTMKWGLVPHWSKHEDLTLNTINARSENLVEGTGMWKSLRGWKRCAIPCDGYFEWLKKGKERIPYFTKREDGRMLLLAGLYDGVVLEGQTEPLYSFTIVTTSANKEYEWLHERQPVMLSTTEALLTWLDTDNHKWDSTIVDLMNPYHDADAPLQCYQVPKEVGKVGTESSTFIEPITARKDGIQAMFARQAAKSGTSPSSSQTKQDTATPSSSQVTSSPNTPQKRRRDSSGEALPTTPKRPKHEAPSPKQASGEVIDLCDDDDDEEDVKGKAEKVNAWEDDEIEYVDPPESPSKPKKSAKESPEHKAKKGKPQDTKLFSTPKKSKQSKKLADDGSPKITSFFKRAK